MAREIKQGGFTPKDLEASAQEMQKKREQNVGKEIVSVLVAIKKPELTGEEVLDALDKAVFLLEAVDGEEAREIHSEIEKLSQQAFPTEKAPYDELKKKLVRAVELSQPVWEMRTEKGTHIPKERGHREARA